MVVKECNELLEGAVLTGEQVNLVREAQLKDVRDLRP